MYNTPTDIANSELTAFNVVWNSEQNTFNVMHRSLFGSRAFEYDSLVSYQKVVYDHFNEYSESLPEKDKRMQDFYGHIYNVLENMRSALLTKLQENAES